MRFTVNKGSGIPEMVDAADGLTVGRLFQRMHPQEPPSSFHVRVNRQPVSLKHALQEGDDVRFIPVRIEGA